MYRLGKLFLAAVTLFISACGPEINISKDFVDGDVIVVSATSAWSEQKYNGVVTVDSGIFTKDGGAERGMLGAFDGLDPLSAIIAAPILIPAGAAVGAAKATDKTNAEVAAVESILSRVMLNIPSANRLEIETISRLRSEFSGRGYCITPDDHRSDCGSGLQMNVFTNVNYWLIPADKSGLPPLALLLDISVVANIGGSGGSGNKSPRSFNFRVTRIVGDAFFAAGSNGEALKREIDAATAFGALLLSEFLSGKRQQLRGTYPAKLGGTFKVTSFSG